MQLSYYLRRATVKENSLRYLECRDGWFKTYSILSLVLLSLKEQKNIGLRLKENIENESKNY